MAGARKHVEWLPKELIFFRYGWFWLYLPIDSINIRLIKIVFKAGDQQSIILSQILDDRLRLPIWAQPGFNSHYPYSVPLIGTHCKRLVIKIQALIFFFFLPLQWTICPSPTKGKFFHVYSGSHFILPSQKMCSVQLVITCSRNDCPPTFRLLYLP